MKYVTLAADASVGHGEHGNGATGFAYYVRSDLGTVKKAWHIDEQWESTAKSELAALVYGMTEAVKHMDGGYTKLIVYCDNLVCIDALRYGLHSSHAVHFKEEFEELIRLGRKFSEVEARHVKAHTKRFGSRFYMNRWCDINARRQRRYKGLRPIREQLYGKAGFIEAAKTRAPKT